MHFCYFYFYFIIDPSKKRFTCKHPPLPAPLQSPSGHFPVVHTAPTPPHALDSNRVSPEGHGDK